MVAVMLLLGLYMWMTYLSAVRDISERAGNQLPWAMFYESYHRASLPELRGDLSLVSSVEGMNDVLSRRYHSEVSLDTIALYMDSLLSVVGLNRDFTILEVDGMGKILRRSNSQETSTALKTRVFSTRRGSVKRHPTGSERSLSHTRQTTESALPCQWDYPDTLWGYPAETSALSRRTENDG